jgi:hypothetical protein
VLRVQDGEKMNEEEWTYADRVLVWFSSRRDERGSRTRESETASLDVKTSLARKPVRTKRRYQLSEAQRTNGDSSTTAATSFLLQTRSYGNEHGQVY